ncbi:hypothetical protein SUGI_0069430 [Cryptomeria japonica]|nr:hypothetical protein SUGI_0069430 [Cryptomeria japonica]
MSAEEVHVINVQSGQDECIPVHGIDNQNIRKEGIIGKLWLLLNAVREKGIVRKLKLLLSAVFCTEEAPDEEVLYRDGKTLLIIFGIIMAGNCSVITSVPSNLENRDEGFHQGVLIPATLSFMTMLFLIAAQVVMPKFNSRRVKMLVVLAIIFTACSYTAFVAKKLGPISQGTVVVIIIAAIYMFFCVTIFIYPKSRIESPQALG